MKKILGVVLALCMLCGLVPLTAFAESTLYDVTVTGAEYSVLSGTVGADAFDDADGGLDLSLKSEAGVILSDTISVTVGGEDFYNFSSYIQEYNASDDSVTLTIHISNDDNGYVDGDIVITLSEETAPRVETLFPTATAVTETKQFEVAYTTDADYHLVPWDTYLEFAYDANVYAVEMEADEEIWISSYSDEDADGDTWVLVCRETDDGYETVTFIDNDNKNDLQESTVFTAPEDGKYYFVFTHYGSAEGTYLNSLSLDNIPVDMTSFLEAAAPLANTTVSCVTANNYLLDGAVYSAVAAFKTDETKEFLLSSDDENATVSYMILYNDPEEGYVPGLGGDIEGGTKEVLTLGTGEILVLLESGSEPYDATIKLMAPALTDVLDFTATSVPTPSEDDQWAWDADKKELTLKDGFNMQVDTLDSQDSAILLPDGATVIVDGDAYIVSTGYVFRGMGAFTLKGKTGRADTLTVEANMWSVLADKDVLVENCTVNGQGGFGSVTNMTLNNVKTKIVGVALAAAVGDSLEDRTTVVVKDSDVTFSGYFAFAAIEKVSVENSVSHIFTVLPHEAWVGQIAPVQVKGGAMTWMHTADEFDLGSVQVDSEAAFALLATEGFCATDKADLLTAENLVLYNQGEDVIYEGALLEDMLFYDDETEKYYLVVNGDETTEYPICMHTAYFADMADAKVVADAKEYAHDDVIKVDATALTPAVGVYGNTRLLPASWKVGDKEGTFEDGDYTIKLNAAELGAGEHTVVVTYAYEKMDVDKMNNFRIMPLLKSVWEEAEADFELTASTTFKVLAKPTTSPGEGGSGTPAPVVPAPTGDTVSTLPFIVLTVASALGLVTLALTKKRKA